MEKEHKIKDLRKEAREIQKDRNIKYSEALDIVAKKLHKIRWNKIFMRKNKK